MSAGGSVDSARVSSGWKSPAQTNEASARGAKATSDANEPITRAVTRVVRICRIPRSVFIVDYFLSEVTVAVVGGLTDGVTDGVTGDGVVMVVVVFIEAPLPR